MTRSKPDSKPASQLDSTIRKYTVRLLCRNCGLRCETQLSRGIARVRHDDELLEVCPRCGVRQAYHEPVLT
jgi:transcription elongation factor Elf1